MSLRPGCYDLAQRFKPEWALRTPVGCRDEMYIVPFTFTVPGDGTLAQQLPVSLDDDVPFLLRGIIFPQIGLGALPPLVLNPGFCRIRDTVGNALSDRLILTLGAWAESGWDEGAAFSGVGTAAFGFSIEPEIDCEPGGVLLFDFQLTTNAAVAFVVFAGVLESIQFNAGVFGTAGNAWTVQLINPGAPNVPLSAAVVAGVIQVTLATNGGAAITSTFAQVAAIINSTAGAGYAFVTGTNPAEVVTAVGPLAMAGGVASSPISLNGALIGVKRFKDC